MGPDGYDAELDRQLTTIEERYGDLAGVDRERLTSSVEKLRGLLPEVAAAGPAEENLPFVVVVRSTLVPTVAAVERIEVRGKAGWTDMAGELDGYRPIEGVEVPDADAYLLVDVSTGPETLDVTPADALPRITAAGRTPLTIDEGVALLTQHPDVLAERNAYQALASRADNKRIPSFWVSKGAPRLGWCWEGNPHSWLGSASAAQRLAP
ncbi:MAG TPA: DUF5701 family protein [Phycicoccus sp.]